MRRPVAKKERLGILHKYLPLILSIWIAIVCTPLLSAQSIISGDVTGVVMNSKPACVIPGCNLDPCRSTYDRPERPTDTPCWCWAEHAELECAGNPGRQARKTPASAASHRRRRTRSGSAVINREDLLIKRDFRSIPVPGQICQGGRLELWAGHQRQRTARVGDVTGELNKLVGIAREVGKLFEANTQTSTAALQAQLNSLFALLASVQV